MGRIRLLAELTTKIAKKMEAEVIRLQEMHEAADQELQQMEEGEKDPFSVLGHLSRKFFSLLKEPLYQFTLFLVVLACLFVIWLVF